MGYNSDENKVVTENLDSHGLYSFDYRNSQEIESFHLNENKQSKDIILKNNTI